MIACASVLAAVAAMFWRWKRRRGGYPNEGPLELDTAESKVELDAVHPRVELEDSGRRELDGSGVDRKKATEKIEPVELDSHTNAKP